MTDVIKGDTLWSIAQENAPKGESVRSYMQQIKKLNHLEGTTLRPGQILYLP
ncbi:LysM peptidoglycan-binding domain-containing protein [Paenibacillus aurantius]|uniref:LysM peptidoglycan-binding domain-containing protein n=1 Tax=Paenibacillus aurantius TaxID=2918900 RepID=A0AA96L9E1_9BACL|nr:LysM peptidoglycan-binding domain-containing protein [Paenibacillus aurantius]WNQ09153.1 LysM peptidoglycan-binding domain-containing protein [Paenibacillus aurantius]